MLHDRTSPVRDFSVIARYFNAGQREKRRTGSIMFLTAVLEIWIFPLRNRHSNKSFPEKEDSGGIWEKGLKVPGNDAVRMGFSIHPGRTKKVHTRRGALCRGVLRPYAVLVKAPYNYE